MPTQQQYTIRGVSPKLNRALRKRAKMSGKSFNQTVLEALNQQVFHSNSSTGEESFDWLFGAKTLDYKFDQAIDEISRVDDKDWQ